MTSQPISQWNNQAVLEWIDTLELQVSSSAKRRIIKGIRDNDFNGRDLMDMERDDLCDLCGINRMSAKKLYKFIKKRISEEMEDKMCALAINDETSNAEKSFSLKIMMSGNKVVLLHNVCGTDTILSVKKLHLLENEYGDKTASSIDFIFKGKQLENDKKLMDYGISSHALIMIAYRVMGGGLFEEYCNEWTAFYQRCPVCWHNGGWKQKDKLSKGYLHHPGGDKCYFVENKPNDGSLVEVKGDKIRCKGCKSECDAAKWSYKCSNHDYKKIIE